MKSRIQLALGTLAFCSTLLLVISTRNWVTASFSELNTPDLQLGISGKSLDPLGAGCAWALLAGLIAYRVTSGLVRRTVALFLVALSGASLFSALGSRANVISDQVDYLVSEAVGRTVTLVPYSSNIFWGVASLLSMVNLFASLLLATGPTHGQSASRYNRTNAANELTTWQAIDAGLDPTQDS